MNVQPSRRRMFIQMRDRERKQFTKLCRQVDGTRSFYLKWKIRLDDIQFMMDYWNDRSAMEECGLSSILTERARRVKSTLHGQSLGLMVWNFRQLVIDHINRYPPIQTDQGWSGHHTRRCDSSHTQRTSKLEAKGVLKGGLMLCERNSRALQSCCMRKMKRERERKQTRASLLFAVFVYITTFE